MEKMIQSGREENLSKVLVVATIESSLQGLLVVDATERDLLKFADRWMQILTIARNSPCRKLILNSATTEENLWGYFSISQESERSRIDWKQSLLVEHGNNPLLVIIPDLARLSLPAIRACVTLLDSECATLQRNGIDRTWQPRFWCIAGSQSNRLGEVSPHLLDRFALRCKSSYLQEMERLSPIEQFQRYDRTLDPNLDIPVELSENLRELAERSREIIANGVLPLISDEAINRVQAYFTKKVPLGMRRLLTLARLARGLASLDNEASISASVVDRAARLLGISQDLVLPTQPIIHVFEPILPDVSKPKSDQKTEPSSRLSSEEQTEQVVKPDVEQVFSEAKIASDLEVLENPYLEDDSPAMRELEPLKLPMVSTRSPRVGFGHPIGTQPATNLEDISLFGTVMEAAKFQNYRKNLPRLNQERSHFQIWLTDLRSYRRVPMPQYQLICAIDFTCLQDRLWQDALLPHLRDWAYVNRASIVIIRIGAKDAKEHLRSQLVQARNLLAPEVFKALEGESGVATPLAHGLELAGRTARGSLQHGRSQMTRVRLVVLTDGRGNIPLQASLDGVLDRPISQEGIDDALTVAKALSEIPRLEIVMLDPQPQFYKELPQRLAKELGEVDVKKVEIKQPLVEIEAMETLEPISLGEGL